MLAHRLSRTLFVAIIAALVVALVPALPRTEAAGGSIAYGQVVSGQIDNVNYFEMWEFAGTKGDRVTITMVGDATLDPYLGLIEAATEQVIAEDDDSAGNSDALIQVTLPSSGSFIIIATRYDFDLGSSQGVYNLQLQGGTGPQNNVNTTNDVTGPQEIEPGVYLMGALELAAPVQNSIDANSYAHIYTVDLEAGTNLLIAMFADSSTLDAYLMFGTQAGDVLAEDDDSGVQVDGGRTDALIQLTVPETGTYLIVATRAGLDVGQSSGAYLLVAGVPEEPEQPEPVNNDMPPGVEFGGSLTVGSTANGAITPTSFVHLYEVQGSAGEMITVTMTGTSGDLDAYLGLIDPNDEVIAEDDDSAGGLNAQISIRLPESGSYLIVATRNGLDEGSTTGNYTLELTSGPPPAPENVSGLGGFGGLPGRSFQSADTTVYLRGFGATDNPDKASPLEQFLGMAETPGALPGRSFQNGVESFYLTGYGRSSDPAKATPIEAFFANAGGTGALPGRSGVQITIAGPAE